MGCVPFMVVCVHVRSVSFSALTLTNEVSFWFRFVNFSKVTPHMGAEPGRAKRKSRIACMRMLRTPPPPIFSPKSGEKPYLEVLSRLGLWRDFLNYSMRNKITQFWLVESSTINPKLYSVGVPINFPWKRSVRTIISGKFQLQCYDQ